MVQLLSVSSQKGRCALFLLVLERYAFSDGPRKENLPTRNRPLKSNQDSCMLTGCPINSHQFNQFNLLRTDGFDEQNA